MEVSGGMADKEFNQSLLVDVVIAGPAVRCTCGQNCCGDKHDVSVARALNFRYERLGEINSSLYELTHILSVLPPR